MLEDRVGKKGDLIRKREVITGRGRAAGGLVFGGRILG